jgi:hypothetical protein
MNCKTRDGLALNGEHSWPRGQRKPGMSLAAGAGDDFFPMAAHRVKIQPSCGLLWPLSKRTKAPRVGSRTIAFSRWKTGLAESKRRRIRRSVNFAGGRTLVPAGMLPSERDLLFCEVLLSHPKNRLFLVMPRSKNRTSRMDQETGRTSMVANQGRSRDGTSGAAPTTFS